MCFLTETYRKVVLLQIPLIQTPYKNSFFKVLKAFSAYGFRVSIVLCDGASSNLTLLKMLCGLPRKALAVNDDEVDLSAKYYADMSFTNPEDPSGNPIFAIICPSHQVILLRHN